MKAKAKKTELTIEERLVEALVPESEQPYPVPDNWVWVRGSSCLLKMTTKKPVGKSFKYIDIDSIDNNHQTVTEPKILSVSDAPSRASREVCQGDTLFSMVRPYLRNIAYIDENLKDCIASTGFFVCKPSRLIYCRYLYKLMISNYVVDGLNKFMKGDNSPSIRQENIFYFPFPLPPLPEQHRIVARIESLFEKLDRAKELAQTALDTFETPKAAILHKAFTGELTVKWREENGVGMDSWEEQTVTSLCSNIVDCPHSTPIWELEGIICIRTSNIKEGFLDLSDVKYVSKDTFLERTQRLKPQAGDVLLTREGSIGDVGVIPNDIELCMGQRMMLLRPLICESNFLVYFFRNPEILASIKSQTIGTTAPRMNVKDIKNLALKCPTLPEQQEIVRILDNLLEKEKTAQELCDVVEKIDLMKKAVLARAFRGELGTNDPGEAKEIVF